MALHIIIYRVSHLLLAYFMRYLRVLIKMIHPVYIIMKRHQVLFFLLHPH